MGLDLLTSPALGLQLTSLVEQPQRRRARPREVTPLAPASPLGRLHHHRLSLQCRLRHHRPSLLRRHRLHHRLPLLHRRLLCHLRRLRLHRHPQRLQHPKPRLSYSDRERHLPLRLWPPLGLFQRPVDYSMAVVRHRLQDRVPFSRRRQQLRPVRPALTIFLDAARCLPLHRELVVADCSAVVY